jgi:hypothetical protein
LIINHLNEANAEGENVILIAAPKDTYGPRVAATAPIGAAQKHHKVHRNCPADRPACPSSPSRVSRPSERNRFVDIMMAELGELPITRIGALFGDGLAPISDLDSIESDDPGHSFNARLR